MVNLIDPQMDHGDDTFFLGLKTEALPGGWITWPKPVYLGSAQKQTSNLGLCENLTQSWSGVSPGPPLLSPSSPASVTIHPSIQESSVTSWARPAQMSPCISASQPWKEGSCWCAEWFLVVAGFILEVAGKKVAIYSQPCSGSNFPVPKDLQW